MSDIEVLLKCIERGHLLGPSFNGIDTEVALSNRDEPQFESEWLRLFEAVENVQLSAQQMATIDRLREGAFNAMFDLSGNSDLSGYVSDDFEVIGKGVASRQSDYFLSGLLKAYVDGTLPGGINVGSEQSTDTLIHELRQKI